MLDVFEGFSDGFIIFLSFVWHQRRDDGCRTFSEIMVFVGHLCSIVSFEASFPKTCHLRFYKRSCLSHSTNNFRRLSLLNQIIITIQPSPELVYTTATNN